MIRFFLRKKRWDKRRLQWFSKQLSLSVKGRLLRLFLILISIIILHSLAISYIEDVPLWTGFWLTFTSITTVGYGDISAKTMYGQLATITLIYIMGIWLLAQLAGEYIDFRMDRRERMIKGQWRWKQMRDHIIIINTPMHDRDRYLSRLINQIRNTPETADVPVQILANDYPEGLPIELRELSVVHFHASVEEPGALDMVNLDLAQHIIILAEDTSSTRSDSFTLDILDRLKRIDHHASILAECVSDDNKGRFIEAGATVVMRPIRAYPEMTIRAIAAPGTQEILENLFTHNGDSACRYDIQIKDKAWAEIATKLVNADMGTPLGYIGENGEVITNPRAKNTINASALILMVKDEATPSFDSVHQILAGVAEPV